MGFSIGDALLIIAGMGGGGWLLLRISRSRRGKIGLGITAGLVALVLIGVVLVEEGVRRRRAEEKQRQGLLASGIGVLRFKTWAPLYVFNLKPGVYESFWGDIALPRFDGHSIKREKALGVIHEKEQTEAEIVYA